MKQKRDIKNYLDSSKNDITSDYQKNISANKKTKSTNPTLVDVANTIERKIDNKKKKPSRLHIFENLKKTFDESHNFFTKKERIRAGIVFGVSLILFLVVILVLTLTLYFK